MVSCGGVVSKRRWYTIFVQYGTWYVHAHLVPTCQHSMKNRRAMGLLNPMHNKIEGKNRGGEGTAPVTTACPDAEKYKCEKKQISHLGYVMILLQRP